MKIDLLINSDQADLCLTVLSRIAQKWTLAESDGQRDSIGAPAFNGYQAVGATVNYQTVATGRQEVPVKFRIRSAARYLSRPPVCMPQAWWEDAEAREMVRAHPPDFVARVRGDLLSHLKQVWITGEPAHFDRKLRNGDLVRAEGDIYFTPRILPHRDPLPAGAGGKQQDKGLGAPPHGSRVSSAGDSWPRSLGGVSVRPPPIPARHAFVKCLSSFCNKTETSVG